MISKVCLLVILGLFVCTLVPSGSAGAQEGRDQIPPHLGYGVHFGPNTSVTPDLVRGLNVDWVKVYTIESSSAFRDLRVLYRMDVGWPDNWDAFRAGVADHVRAIASHPIEAVEVHNEPNLRNEWAGRTPNAWQYVQVLRVVYQTIKAIKPSLIVVSGGLAPTITTADRGAISDLEFAREMFENNADQWFDAFGYHPYGYNMPPEADPYGAQPLVFRRTERIRALMERYGIYKQIWLTEFGWLRDPREEGYQCSDFDPVFSGFAWLRVSGETQADYLERAFEYAHRNWPWAGPMFVWNLNWMQMDWLQACDHMRWFALLRPNGQPTIAYRRFATMPRYTSDYRPRLVIEGGPLRGDLAVGCPNRVLLGQITVQNIGYPVPVNVSVEPVNGGPLFVEVTPERVRPGQRIRIYGDATNIRSPGQYPVYVNLRTTIAGQPFSQSVQGVINAWQGVGGC